MNVLQSASQATHLTVVSCPVVGTPHFGPVCLQPFCLIRLSMDNKLQSSQHTHFESRRLNPEQGEAQPSIQGCPSKWTLSSCFSKDAETPRRTVLHSPLFLMCFKTWLSAVFHLSRRDSETFHYILTFSTQSESPA